MASTTGSIADFHPADTNYNPAIRRHSGRPAAYRRSPLSAQLNPEAISAPETPASDRSNRPRLTIHTSDLSTSPEPAGDEADTPHPSQDDGFSSADEVLDSYFEPQAHATTNTSGPVSPEDITDDNDRSTGDDPLSPVSPIAGPSTVGPHVSIANEPHPRQPLTPLQQQRETLRNLLRDFDRHILEPGEDEPRWMRFRGALQPAVQTLATDQIIHALKQHLPSVQETLSQNAQLRGALARTEARQNADEVEMERLRAETRGLRGALNRLEVSPELREDVMDLTLENEQVKTELEKAQNELQESFEERQIEEGNLRLEIAAGEDALATLQREHDAMLADRQLLRTQAQQTTQSSQRAQQHAREAYQEAVTLRAQLRKAQAELEATTDRIAILEGQVTESCGVVLDLRGQIYNLQSRPHSPDSDSPESYPAPISPPSPRPPQPARFPSTSAQDTTAPSSPPFPLQQARRDLLVDQDNIASIIDPLEASAYSARSVSKTAIHHATESGLAGSQIVKAIRDHLPDIRDRQTIKAAYRRLQLRSVEDQKLVERLRSAAANKQRQIDGWKQRVRVLQRKQREAEGETEEEEEDGTDPVAATTPATVSSDDDDEASPSHRRRANTVDSDAHALLLSDLHETRTLLTTLQRQNTLLLAADESKTAQLHAAQTDVTRLTDETTTLRTALDAASLDAASASATTNEQRQAARIAALGSQLADQRAENATLQARLVHAAAEEEELRARLRECERRGEEQERVVGRLRTQLAAQEEGRARESVVTEARVHSLRMGLAIAESRLLRQGGRREREERRRQGGGWWGLFVGGGGRRPAGEVDADADADADAEIDGDSDRNGNRDRNWNVAVMSEGRWRNGNWNNAGPNGVDVLAFWGLMVAALGVGSWVVGGEVSASRFVVLFVLCFGLGGGAAGVGGWRGRFGLR